jgi:hypothetical protein
VTNRLLDQIQILNKAFSESEKKWIAEIAALRSREQAISGELRLACLQREVDASKLAESEKRERESHAQHDLALNELRCIEQAREQREKERAEQSDQAFQRLEILYRTLMQREQEATEKLLDIQQRLQQQEKEELVLYGRESVVALQREYADREQALGLKLQAEQQECRRLAQELVRCETEHAELARQSRQALENLARSAVQREQELAAQLLTAQQRVAQELSEQTQRHGEAMTALCEELEARERALGQNLESERQERLRSEHAREQRDREHAEQISRIQSDAQRLVVEEARRYSEREDHLQVKLSTLRELYERHQVDAIRRERDLTAKIEAQGDAIDNLKLAILEQERRLAAAQSLAAILRAELEQQTEYAETLTNELAEIRKTMVWRLSAFLTRTGALFGGRKHAVMGSGDRAPSVDGGTAAARNSCESGRYAATNVSREGASPAAYARAIDEQRSYESYNIRQEHDMTNIEHVDQLLMLQDTVFVEMAYRVLLGRLPDPDGLRYYRGRLRAGYSKPALVVQITDSPEAKKYNPKLAGLEDLRTRQRRLRHPVFGLIWNLIYRQRLRDRQLNRLEYQQADTCNAIADYLVRVDQSGDVIRAAVQGLERRISALSETMADMPGRLGRVSQHSDTMQAALQTMDAKILALTKSVENISQLLNRSMLELIRKDAEISSGMQAIAGDVAANFLKLSKLVDDAPSRIESLVTNLHLAETAMAKNTQSIATDIVDKLSLFAEEIPNKLGKSAADFRLEALEMVKTVQSTLGDIVANLDGTEHRGITRSGSVVCAANSGMIAESANIDASNSRDTLNMHEMLDADAIARVRNVIASGSPRA